jgi:hypothetical protein
LFYDLKSEFHLLPADNETQVHLPKTTEPDKPVHQELNSHPFPKPRQFDMQGDLAQFKACVPVPLSMVTAEEVGREGIQAPMVRGVAP